MGGDLGGLGGRSTLLPNLRTAHDYVTKRNIIRNVHTTGVYPGGWGSRPPDFWAGGRGAQGGRGQVVKCCYILSCQVKSINALLLTEEMKLIHTLTKPEKRK